MLEVVGTVTSVVFENEKRSYTVFRLAAEDRTGTLNVTVNSFAPMVGEMVTISGDWITHSRYGKQFAGIQWRPNDQRAMENIALFLEQRVGGIGPKLAARIIAKFGEELESILRCDPEKLTAIRGISCTKAREIGKLFSEHNEIREIKIFLEGNGVTGSFAPRIATYYGTAAVEIIRDNPYRLCEDFDDISFKTADVIAKKSGLDTGCKLRMRSGIVYALLQTLREGHCCYPREGIVKLAQKHLSLPGSEVDDEVVAMLKDSELVVDEDHGIELLFLPFMNNLENMAATNLLNISAEAEVFSEQEISRLVELIEQISHIELANQQKRAIISALTEGVTIISGGPGTGKTTIIRCMRELFEHCGLQVVLAAPTGRAARRLSDASGGTATTIHRLLEAQNDPTDTRFLRNEYNRLDGDVFIIDETSMMDINLFFHLLEALPEGARLVLVGDTDQLPSVGAGLVLRDLIKADCIPAVQLEEIFRQAADSGIVHNSHRIRKGLMPEFGKFSDFDYFAVDNANIIANKIVELYLELSLQGLDIINDIQVLSPMYRAESGVENLNKLLQNHLNPAGDPVKIAGENTPFRCGDKVMQTRNNYEKLIYNGDIGIVNKFGDNGMIVEFYGNSVLVELENLRDIQLAYAITVHKSQGSEYPVVLLVLCKEHVALLSRPILYTAVTRAKSRLIIVGGKSSLCRAVETERSNRRWTMLETKLRRQGD